MRRWALPALLLFVVILLPQACLAALDNSWHVIVEKDFLNSDIPPVNEAGYVLVPLRAITEQLGANVDWDPASRTATVRKGGNTVQISTESVKAIVNGTPSAMPLAARVVQGRLMVPLRFMAEALGLNVHFGYLGEGTPTVWVTSFKLLEPQDAAVTSDYTEVVFNGPHWFKLNPGGSTTRGIKLGDPVDRVKQLYGQPFSIDVNPDGEQALRYVGMFMPNSDGGLSLIFICRDGYVADVFIE